MAVSRGRARRIARALACLAFASGAASAALTVNQSFAPNSVVKGQASTLTIVFLNPNADPATATAVTDALPANVVVAATPNATTTCGGTVTATPAAASLSLAGATVPAAVGSTPGQCQFSVDVVSGTPGSYINTIAAGAVSSSEGSNGQAAQATLVVAALASVTGTQTFAPANLHGSGAPSVLTLNLANPNGIALTSVAFSDALPGGVVVASTPNATTTCGGTVTAAAGAASLQLSGGTIPANGSCKVTVSVAASNPNTAVNATRTNTIAAGAVTTAEGVSNTAFSGSVTLQTGAGVSKTFAPATITSGGTTKLTLTLRDFNSVAIGGADLTDTLPGTMVVASTPSVSNTCGGTVTATPGAGSVSISGATIPAAPSGAGSGTCAVALSVTATNGGTSAVTLANNIPAGAFAGFAYASTSAGLVVNPVSNIAGAKTFAPTSVPQTGSATMTITLSNAVASAAAIASVTDNLASMGTGFTVAGAPGGTCGVSMTSAVGSTTFTATGGTIPASGSCTITLPIAIGSNAPANLRTNTIAANGVQTDQGNNVIALAGSVSIVAALTATKSWTPSTIAAGGVSRATITLAHANGAVPLSSLAFTDTLPAGHTVASPANASTTCGGTLTAVPGAGTFSLAGASLGAGATSCNVQVDVRAPATAGSASNALPGGSITTAQGVTAGDVAATLTRVATSLTINQSFTPNTVAVGGFAQLAIQIQNTGANAIALTGVGLTDVLPAGMTIPSAAGLAFTGTSPLGAACTTTSLTSTSGQIVLANASVPANTVCTLTAKVQASAAGNLINTLPAGAVTSAQGATNPSPAAATLASTGAASLTILDSDGTATATPGGTTTYTITVANAGPDDVAGLGVVDTPPPGVTFGSWSCTATPGSACAASGTGAIGDSVTLLANGKLTYTVDAAIDSALTGTLTNVASLNVPGSVVDDQPTDATDVDTLVPVAALAVAVTDGTPTYIPGATGTYTITVGNAGPSDAVDVTVTDALPAGVTVNGPVTCVASGTAACGAPFGALGSSSAGTSGASVRAGAGNGLTLAVPVAFASDLAPATVVDTVTATDTPSGATASASDSDTPAPVVGLALALTDGSASYTPGGSGVYTATLTNAGPSEAQDVSLQDALPPGVLLSAAATCAATGNAGCGSVTGSAGAAAAGVTGARIGSAPGDALVLTMPVAFAAASTADPLVNTATAIEPASGSAAAASDSDARSARVSLAVSVSDGSTTYQPGGTAVYVIRVRNGGLSDALDVQVDDALPPGVVLTGAVTCTASGSAACGAITGDAGATSLHMTGASVAAGSGNALVLLAPVAFDPAQSADPLIDSASAVDAATGASGEASDSDARLASVALAVAVSDGQSQYTPGGTATYTVTVTDTGASDALDVAIAATLPPGVTLRDVVTCSASGSATCGSVSGAAGEAALASSGARIPAGAGNSIVLAVPVRFAALMRDDPLILSATATDATSGASGSASDADGRLAQSALAVTITDGSATYTPGGGATYLVAISNAGPSDALALGVADTLPAGVVLSGAPTCVASAAAACGSVTGAPGATSVGMSGAQLPAGAGNALTLTVPVAFAAALAADPLLHTVAAADAASGASATASDSDARQPSVVLEVAVDDGRAAYVPGGTGTYTIGVESAGLSDALDVVVQDDLPPGVTIGAAVTCTAVGAASCGTVVAVIGGTSVRASGGFIATGGGNAITLTVPVRFGAGLVADPLVNAVTASAGAAIAAASDSNARVANAPPAVTVAIPVVNGPLALALAILVALAAARALRACGQRHRERGDPT